MGQPLNVQTVNNAGEVFYSSYSSSQCMYDLNNLERVATGTNTTSVQDDGSGDCFFETSWFVQFWGTANTPTGYSNFGIGWASDGESPGYTPPSDWTTYALATPNGNDTAYCYTFANGWITKSGFTIGATSGGTPQVAVVINQPSSSAGQAARSAETPKRSTAK